MLFALASNKATKAAFSLQFLENPMHLNPMGKSNRPLFPFEKKTKLYSVFSG